MGISTRTNHGIEYLYFLAGKSQLFLGRKDDLQNLNLQNLCRGMRAVDKTFDGTMAKYLREMQEQARYLPKSQQAAYISERIGTLNAMLRRAHRK